MCLTVTHDVQRNPDTNIISAYQTMYLSNKRNKITMESNASYKLWSVRYCTVCIIHFILKTHKKGLNILDSWWFDFIEYTEMNKGNNSSTAL